MMQRILSWRIEERLQSRMREAQGSIRKREANCILLIHMSDNGSHDDFESAKDIEHGRFKGERFVNAALHLGHQVVDWRVLLPV